MFTTGSALKFLLKNPKFNVRGVMKKHTSEMRLLTKSTCENSLELSTSLLSVSVPTEVITGGRSCFETKSIKEGTVKINRKTIKKEKEISLRTVILLSIYGKDIIKTKRTSTKIK